jgi:hypothetical protein
MNLYETLPNAPQGVSSPLSDTGIGNESVGRSAAIDDFCELEMMEQWTPGWRMIILYV